MGIFAKSSGASSAIACRAFCRAAAMLLIFCCLLAGTAVLPPSLTAAAAPLSNEQVRTAILTKFADAGLKPFFHNIRIQVNDGRVTIEGQIETERERRLAERLAAETAGVRQVENKLTVAALLAGEADNRQRKPAFAEEQPRQSARTEQGDGGLTTVANAASTAIFFTLLAFITVILLICGFFIVLWSRKRREDQLAYRNVLGKEQVQTFYSPEDYKKSIERRSRQ